MADTPPPKKKRGRKPKGGKVVKAPSVDENVVIPSANIILHLKCGSEDLKNADLPEELRLGAVLRDEKIIIPKSNFVFEKKDKVVFLAKRDQIPLIENLFV